MSSHSIGDFKLTVFSRTTALLTDRAQQVTTGGGTAGPGAVWASSLFVKRDGH